jgi:hypothetical protein
MDKKSLSERDICTKFITPAIESSGWDRTTQFLEEVNLTSGRVVVRGNKARRDEKTIRRADYVLYFKPGIPIAVVEAKDNNHTVRDGIQQALAYRLRPFSPRRIHGKHGGSECRMGRQESVQGRQTDSRSHGRTAATSSEIPTPSSNDRCGRRRITVSLDGNGQAGTGSLPRLGPTCKPRRCKSCASWHIDERPRV